MPHYMPCSYLRLNDPFRCKHLFILLQSRRQALGGQSAIELVQLSNRIPAVTEYTSETMFLFQRLSIVLQRGNVVAFLSTSSLCGQCFV